MFKFLLGVLLFTSQAFGVDLYPSAPKELKAATVKVTNNEGYSGGTGVIYRSYANASYILTNSHVCEVLSKDGGKIVTSKGTYKVEKYKHARNHDLCLVMVIADLKVNTKLANSGLGFGDYVQIAGHPYLNPLTISTGSYSGTKRIELLVGMEACTPEENANPDLELLCHWFGGIPIIKTFESGLTSALIAPGNSGSAVFNGSGEIVGLAFAGTGRGLSHSFIVPLAHIKTFLAEVHRIPFIEANGPYRYMPIETSNSKRAVVKTNSYDSIVKYDLTKLFNASFPAVKSDTIERIYIKVNQCRLGSSQCQKLLK
jgi:S1-C subfamily serine protease